jgi:hypothetical protein
MGLPAASPYTSTVEIGTGERRPSTVTMPLSVT